MKLCTRLINILNIVLLPTVLALLCGGFFSGGGAKFVAIAFLVVLFFDYIHFNISPSKVKNPSKRLQIMWNGRELMLIYAWASVLLAAVGAIGFFLESVTTAQLIIYIVTAVVIECIVIFNGAVRVFTTSKQLGIVLRALAVCVWWLPIVNFIIMVKSCAIVKDEYEFDTEYYELDTVRKESVVCSRRYPLLMVHGVFFPDMRFFNYWGRVPKELIRNGAVVYYGEQPSADSVEGCARELKKRIEKIVSETGCEKVNIIAHSKGGLDSRYAISCLGMDKYVASLTTINTPHRGCAFADYLLKAAPAAFKSFVAGKYNSTLRKLGDKDPDFIAAVTDLTVESCAKLNKTAQDIDGVYYQSVGARMKKQSSAGFLLGLSYGLVRHFSKCDNDGLVDVDSMKWGSRHIFFEPKTNRGLSHGDVIDLLREDIKGFDIREEYVGIVKDLKARGL